MMTLKRLGILLVGLSMIAAIVAVAVSWGGTDTVHLEQWLTQLGGMAPIAFVAIYAVATLVMVPSTPLNVSGGVLFGLWPGLLWTSIGAVGAALVTFWASRTLGRLPVEQRFVHRWQSVEAELVDRGTSYIFAIRLLPMIPYGLVNLVAGMTSIRLRDYAIGTVLGTIPGIFPFVWLGSSGRTAMNSGTMWPVVAALGLIGVMVGGATWFRHRTAKG